MKEDKLLKQRRLARGLSLFLTFVVWFLPTLAIAATMDSVVKYAWGDHLGWVNFNPADGGVLVSDTALSGYAWSENFGWINLSPEFSGIKNDGQGLLSGQAWSDNLGWIDFSGVRINDGLFSGQASGSQAGNINFDCLHCAVRTAWRPNSATGEQSSTPLPPVYPQSGAVGSVVNGTVSMVSNSTNIIIPLSGGSDVKGVALSLDSNFKQSDIRPFQDNLPFNICPSGRCAPGKYEVWLKFFSFTGHSSEVMKIIIDYRGEGGSFNCRSDREEFLAKERLVASNSKGSSKTRLSGRILIQVEDLGRAWYVYPKDTRRYYLGCPNDAFRVMRELSLGISNIDFSRLNKNRLRNLAGLILLKVEDSGKAYYINPITLEMHYLGRPEDAFSLMRSIGLGISNANLRRINLEK